MRAGARTSLRIAGDVGLAALLGLLWLTTLGMYRLVPPPWAVTWGFGITAAFYLTHVYARRPRSWYSGRLAWPAGLWAHLPTAFLVGVLLSCGKIGMHLAFRDVATPDASVPGRSVAWAVLVIASFPLVEEVVFRGWMQKPLEERLGPVAGIAIVAVVFAAFHGFGGPFWLRLVEGGCYGALVWAVGSIWPSLVVHVAGNGMLVALNTVPSLNEQALTLAAAQPTWLAPSAVVLYLSTVALALTWIRRVWTVAGRHERRGRTELAV